MPSKNSVNKPNFSISRKKRASSLGQKRAHIRAKGNTNSTLHILASSPSSIAYSLYSNKTKSKTPVTTQTLSAKRLLKIERNKKYVEARDAKNKKKSQDIDTEIDVKENLNKVTIVRNALWSIVENATSGQNVPTGNGTTLGGPNF